MRWLLADWGRSKRERFDAVAEGLRGLGYEVVRIQRNGMKHRPALLDAITSGGFDAMMTWQRIFGMQRDIRRALKRSGIRTVYMDFGFVPHYRSVVFDSKGENATSSWPAMWRAGESPEVERRFEDEACRLVEGAAARLARMDCPFDAQHIGRPFIFVPLQRTGDTVVRYDSSVHDAEAFVRRVLELAGRQLLVVVKTHPLDCELKLGVPDHEPGRHMVIRSGFGDANEAACDWLLGNAAAVVGINTSMLFRAMTFGTPIVATGRGWYSGSGVLHEVDGLGDLHDLTAPVVRRSEQLRYIAFCLSRQLRFAELSDPKKLGPLLDRILSSKPDVRAPQRKAPAMPNIPRVFHQVWLGAEIPKELVRIQRRLLELHPGWDHKLWTPSTLPHLVNADLLHASTNGDDRASIAKYEVLAQYGGVYVDIDLLFQRSIEPLLDNADHVLIAEPDGGVSGRVMAFEKNHPMAWALVREAAQRPSSSARPGARLGTEYLTDVVTNRFPAARILPSQLLGESPDDEAPEAIQNRSPSWLAARKQAGIVMSSNGNGRLVSET